MTDEQMKEMETEIDQEETKMQVEDDIASSLKEAAEDAAQNN